MFGYIAIEVGINVQTKLEEATKNINLRRN